MIKNSKKWYICPVCKKGKLCKFDTDTTCVKMYLWCKICKTEIEVTIPEEPKSR